MMTVPEVSDMPAGYVVQVGDMNNLAAACSFLLGKPMAKVVATTARGGLLTSSAGSRTQFDMKAFDTDGMWSAGTSGRLTVQTPGMYVIRYTVVANNNAYFNSWVTSTTGSNNPLGSGVVSPARLPGYGSGNSGLPSTGFGCKGLWPYFLYAGDYIQMFAQSSVNTSWSVTPCGSSLSLEYAST